MSAYTTDIDGAALDWLVRVNDLAFEAWADWEAWMAADPRHADAYWRMAADEAEAVEALRQRPPGAVRIPRPRLRPAPSRRAAVAAAFALVAASAGWIGWSQRPQPWIVQTAPGETRSLTLADGSRLSLDGATRLTMDRRDPRRVTLTTGRALFEVVHDETDPFVVLAGDAVLTDLGTTFDVTRHADGARVAVSEGVVKVDLRDHTATLNPGDGVLAAGGTLERRSVAPEDVAAWREGRLSYAGERLDVVAADLARVLDRPITVDPALANRRFSGSLDPTVEPADQRTRLARLLGVSVAETGEGWRLEP